MLRDSSPSVRARRPRGAQPCPARARSVAVLALALALAPGSAGRAQWGAAPAQGIFANAFESGDVAAWHANLRFFALVHRIGRFDLAQPAGPRFAWPGSALQARFAGTALSIELEETGSNRYEIVVDGVVRPVLFTAAGQAVYPLVGGLAAGEHTASITRRTESFFGVSRFLGFPGASLVASEDPARWFEVIGDSITCGYGVLGPDAWCSFTADTEAETFAWGALAAAQLGAAHTAIAYSGKGAYRNYGGDTVEPMPVLWQRTLADVAGSAWDFHIPPAALVVNLGTNDFASGDPGAAYVTAMTDFVAQLRAHHPAAVVVLASSPMLEGANHTAQVAYLQQVVSAAGAGVSLLDLATQDPEDGYGCDFHPSVLTQERMAAALTLRLQTLLGW